MACCLALLRAGRRMAMRKAMMAMTTRSSTRVKAGDLVVRWRMTGRLLYNIWVVNTMRIWRWIGNFALGLLVAMFCAAAALWIRSYGVGDEIVRSQIGMSNVAGDVVRARHHYLFIRSSRGRVRIS